MNFSKLISLYKTKHKELKYKPEYNKYIIEYLQQNSRKFFVIHYDREVQEHLIKICKKHGFDTNSILYLTPAKYEKYSVYQEIRDLFYEMLNNATSTKKDLRYAERTSGILKSDYKEEYPEDEYYDEWQKEVSQYVGVEDYAIKVCEPYIILVINCFDSGTLFFIKSNA